MLSSEGWAETVDISNESDKFHEAKMISIYHQVDILSEPQLMQRVNTLLY